MARTSTSKHHAEVSSHKSKSKSHVQVDLSDKSLIPRPEGRPFRKGEGKGYNLQEEMGLSDNSELYLELAVSHLISTVVIFVSQHNF